MAYNRQNFVENQILEPYHLNNIEDGIVVNEEAINTKQDRLIDGENIKTINGINLLGSGNVNIETALDIDYDTLLAFDTSSTIFSNSKVTLNRSKLNRAKLS